MGWGFAVSLLVPLLVVSGFRVYNGLGCRVMAYGGFGV